ncbi:MAG TPA: carbohydrate ABC transporter permease [Roseiflexaceae bacterium]|jgi:ABC-type glycerol-3-phosphate transport system permease component|nr:carbohydrate ABC transporter permease [Roseiflexaceae bacterium]
MVGNRASSARLWQVLGNAILIFGVLLMIMPFLYMISASFKPGSEIYTIPFQFFPENIYLGNYLLLFQQTSFIRWFENSVIVALGRTILGVILSLMAGYAFAKFDFRGRNVLFILVIATLTLPIYVILIPLYSMMVRMGWINSYSALILPFGAQAIGVFLARQYLLGVPNELLEAARIDGAGEWNIFMRIILPIAQPVTATMAILFFSAAWKDFIWPLIILNDDKMFTVSLGLPSLIGPYTQEYGAVMAGSFMGTLPILIIFLIMQRRFIEGVMAGAIKG